MIRVRDVMVCDLGGDLDQAVRAYIDLAEIFPEKADTFMPSNIEGASVESQNKSLKILQEALAQASNKMSYWQLEALRLSILELTESEEAGQIAQDIVNQLQKGPKKKSRYRLQMIAIRVEVKHKQFEVALEHLNRLIAEAGENYLPELLLLKGKCLYGLAGSRDDYIKAGLAFMRVIIHFPPCDSGARHD